MKKRKAVIIRLCRLTLFAATLIPALLFRGRAAEKAIVMPVAKMLKLSRVPG